MTCPPWELYPSSTLLSAPGQASWGLKAAAQPMPRKLLAQRPVSMNIIARVGLPCPYVPARGRAIRGRGGVSVMTALSAPSGLGFSNGQLPLRCSHDLLEPPQHQPALSLMPRVLPQPLSWVNCYIPEGSAWLPPPWPPKLHAGSRCPRNHLISQILYPPGRVSWRGHVCVFPVSFSQRPVNV